MSYRSDRKTAKQTDDAKTIQYCLRYRGQSLRTDADGAVGSSESRRTVARIVTDVINARASVLTRIGRTLI